MFIIFHYSPAILDSFLPSPPLVTTLWLHLIRDLCDFSFKLRFPCVYKHKSTNDNILSQDHLQKSSFKKYEALILISVTKVCNGFSRWMALSVKIIGCVLKMHSSIWLSRPDFSPPKILHFVWVCYFLNKIFKKSLQKCSHLKLLAVCPSVHTFQSYASERGYTLKDYMLYNSSCCSRSADRSVKGTTRSLNLSQAGSP